jgi:hypothetical protein
MAAIDNASEIKIDPQLQDAVDDLIRGIRDPEAMRRAAEEMDRDREEIRQRIGETNIAVELIREARDEA